MRRRATSLVVVALLVLATIAAIEAFLRDDGQEAVEPPRAESTEASDSPDSLAEQLEDMGASGLLYFTVAKGERCELNAVRLPTVVVETGFQVPACRFSVSPDGLVATGFDCRETGALWDSNGDVVEQFAGCAPAWKPNGQMTFVQDGEVMVVPRSCSESIDACARVAISEADLEKALGYLPESRSFAVREIAWLTDRRMASIVRSRYAARGPGDLIAVFGARRLVDRPDFGTRGLSNLRVDRVADRIYVRGPPERGYFVLRPDGSYDGTLPFSGVPEIRSIVLSSTSDWTAVAGRASILLFKTQEPTGQVIRLPFAARDLAWVEE